MRRLRKLRESRKGAVTVELAFITPMFIALLIGIWQATAIHHVRNQFLIATREGARMATLDREEIKQGEETANEAVARHIREFLTANEMPGDQVTVMIVDPYDNDIVFDLDDPTNDMKMFRVIVYCSCLDLLPIPPVGLGENFVIGANVVFRNGRAEVVE